MLHPVRMLCTNKGAFAGRKEHIQARKGTCCSCTDEEEAMGALSSSIPGVSACLCIRIWPLSENWSLLPGHHGSGLLQCREDAGSHAGGCPLLLLCLFLLQGTFFTSPYPATNSGDTSRKVNPAELTLVGGISQELKSPHFLRKPG